MRSAADAPPFIRPLRYSNTRSRCERVHGFCAVPYEKLAAKAILTNFFSIRNDLLKYHPVHLPDRALTQKTVYINITLTIIPYNRNSVNKIADLAGFLTDLAWTSL